MRKGRKKRGKEGVNEGEIERWRSRVFSEERKKGGRKQRREDRKTLREKEGAGRSVQ